MEENPGGFAFFLENEILNSGTFSREGYDGAFLSGVKLCRFVIREGQIFDGTYAPFLLN